MKLKWGELPFEEMPERKRLVYLAHIAGFTYREIAEQMATSPKYIKACIAEGYKKYHIKRESIYLLVEGNNTNKTVLCSMCRKKKRCVEPCARLLKVLDSVETKKHDRTFTEYGMIEDLI